MPPTIVPPFNGVMNATGLSRTEGWASLVRQVIAGNGTGDVVTPALALGVIYAESRGLQNEASGPATDWFSSFGLMQVNANAHWKNTGRPLADLFDPATNIDLGTRILRDVIRQWGTVDAGVSAYNGGGRRQVAGTRFCQVWKSGTPATGRSIDRDCVRVYITRDGEFGNQPYVDEVLAAAAVFESHGVNGPSGDATGDSTDQTGLDVTTEGFAGGDALGGIVVVAIVAALGWLALK